MQIPALLLYLPLPPPLSPPPTPTPTLPGQPAHDPCSGFCSPAAKASPKHQADFDEKGFVKLEALIPHATVDRLNTRLERVLRGEFDTGHPPDKRPKFKVDDRVKPGKTRPALGGPSKRTLQVINIWKCDAAFCEVVRSASLAKFVAMLGGWKGARVANDQVWAKPPGAAPITFHRDSTYFDFVPADVITVWVALDTMTPELGPLEYVVGSHKWGDGRSGSAKQFFDARDKRALVDDAARKEGFDDPSTQLEVVMVEAAKGGGSIHNGRTWHGSAGNSHPKLPRRGLGIHFVPAEAEFQTDRPLGKLWRPHKQEGTNKLPDDVFPPTWL